MDEDEVDALAQTGFELVFETALTKWSLDQLDDFAVGIHNGDLLGGSGKLPQVKVQDRLVGEGVGEYGQAAVSISQYFTCLRLIAVVTRSITPRRNFFVIVPGISDGNFQNQITVITGDDPDAFAKANFEIVMIIWQCIT